MEQKNPYLRELGVTAALLMPAYEYREQLRIRRRDRLYSYTEEKRKEDEKPRINCWGYTGDACYMRLSPLSAPQKSCPGVKHMVDSFHQSGLECLMSFILKRICLRQNAGDHKILEKSIPY